MAVEFAGEGAGGTLAFVTVGAGVFVVVPAPAAGGGSAVTTPFTVVKLSVHGVTTTLVVTSCNV